MTDSTPFITTLQRIEEEGVIVNFSGLEEALTDIFGDIILDNLLESGTDKTAQSMFPVLSSYVKMAHCALDNDIRVCVDVKSVWKSSFSGLSVNYDQILGTVSTSSVGVLPCPSDTWVQAYGDMDRAFYWSVLSLLDGVSFNLSSGGKFGTVLRTPWKGAIAACMSTEIRLFENSPHAVESLILAFCPNQGSAETFVDSFYQGLVACGDLIENRGNLPSRESRGIELLAATPHTVLTEG